MGSTNDSSLQKFADELKPGSGEFGASRPMKLVDIKQDIWATQVFCGTQDEVNKFLKDVALENGRRRRDPEVASFGIPAQDESGALCVYLVVTYKVLIPKDQQ